MATTITSAGITFNDATTLTSAVIPPNAVGATQIANGSVTAVKLGTDEQKQIAKAWVNFNGTTSPGTIRSSYNVSSVTKNGVGNYTVNLTSAMPDSNYSALATSAPEASFGNYASTTVTSVSAINVTARISGGPQDTTSVSVAIFGN